MTDKLPLDYSKMTVQQLLELPEDEFNKAVEEARTSWRKLVDSVSQPDKLLIEHSLPDILKIQADANMVLDGMHTPTCNSVLIFGKACNCGQRAER